MTVLHARPHLFPAVAAAGLLVVALGEHPYSYYVFLRWAVTSAAVFVAYLGFREDNQLVAWLFVAVACLFNPIAPVYLARETWRVVDVVAALLFLASLTLRRTHGVPLRTES